MTAQASTVPAPLEADRLVARRTDELLSRSLDQAHRTTDKMFFWLLLVQWAFAIVLALVLSPYAWEGKTRVIHMHVEIAVYLGALINSLPLALIVLRPGWAGTRYAIAVAQMLWSGVLIHLTGGRIETHFHVFGSLAFLAFYRDWRVLVPATITVAADHYLRGAFWPESVFGTLNPEWWRVFEHVGWVVFEDVILIYACVRAAGLYRVLAEREARLEVAHGSVERQVIERTRQLEAEVQERRAREDDLRAARAAAEAASRAKSEFLANMSHEIRTPMNGVLGFTNLLLDTRLDDEQRESVQIIRQSGETLLTIINDILDFSKVEAGKLTVENLPFSLRQAAEQVIELLAPQAEAKGLELVLHVSQDLPQTFTGDAGRVRQVLLNLVGNAIKFTRTGHVLVELELTRALHLDGQDEARCSVSDTGIGIPREKQSLLFREFSQADASTTRQFGGTGLGLAISRRLIELMGGKVEFTSEAGVGSRFSFTLPAPNGVPEAPRGQPAVPELADMRVLIVDDLGVNRKLLTKQLEAWGITHEAVASGARALDVLHRAHVERKPFDIALLDYLMPEMDGLELGQRIKADPVLARTALVMLTSGSQQSAAEEFLLAGFAAFMMKPIVRPSELFDTLIQAWNTHPDRAPAAVSEKAAEPVKVVEPSSPAAAPISEPVEPVYRVLVAEDNNVNQRLVKRMLEKVGCAADVVEHGRDAVTKALHTRYDAILMDCFMPEMDGYEATQEIRRLQAEAGVGSPAWPRSHPSRA